MLSIARQARHIIATWWWGGLSVILFLASPAPLPAQPVTGVVLVAAAWMSLGVAVAHARRRGRSPLRPLASASWARWAEVSSMSRPGSFLPGLWPETSAPLYLDEEQLSGHVLVLGPSRSGKTAGVIAPNVLLRDPARESLVVLDVKTGPRSLNVTAGRYGSRARLFCPFFEGSVSYNPLEGVDSIGTAQRKAALLVHNTTPRDLSGDARVYTAATTDLATLLSSTFSRSALPGATP